MPMISRSFSRLSIFPSSVSSGPSTSFSFNNKTRERNRTRKNNQRQPAASTPPSHQHTFDARKEKQSQKSSHCSSPHAPPAPSPPSPTAPPPFSSFSANLSFITAPSSSSSHFAIPFSPAPLPSSMLLRNRVFAVWHSSARHFSLFSAFFRLLLIIFATLHLLVIRPALGNLIFHQMEFDSDCMKAMCMADSGCNQKGCAKDIFGRMGCGYFRMNIWQFKQCYEPDRQIGEDSERAWIRCSEDFECASKCIVQVASRFRLKCYGKSDCEAIARIHDGGANGCRTGETLPYWSSVKTFCPDC